MDNDKMMIVVNLKDTNNENGSQEHQDTVMTDELMMNDE